MRNFYFVHFYSFIPCLARRYFLQRLGFEEHESFETRTANLSTKHGHTFHVEVTNAPNNTKLGCSNREALCKAYGFQEDMEITFDLRPEDHIEGNIDIWVDVDMLPVLPPCEFVNHVYLSSNFHSIFENIWCSSMLNLPLYNLQLISFL